MHKGELGILQDSQQQQANSIASDEAEEDIKKLCQGLAKAHQDVEDLRTIVPACDSANVRQWC